MSAAEASVSTSVSTPVSFKQALGFWLKLGFISFGGPAGQIALMHQELVERRRWISDARFLHALNYCMLLPGPEAQQLATYIGWLMHRTAGGVAAGVLFVLPSFFILVALSWIYWRWGHQDAVVAVLYGVKPAVVAIVLAAAHRIGSRVLHQRMLWGIAGLAFVATAGWNLPFPLTVMMAALLGALIAHWRPQALMQTESAASGHALPSTDSQAAQTLDAQALEAAHTQFSLSGLLRVIIIFAVIAVLSVLGLAWVFGASSTLLTMAGFFTKAALLTFGGAYAVLPYVFEGAVQQHHWLSAAQMMDGLALGETTPGPLIMVVAFVGFMGGAADASLSTLTPLAAGALAAAVTTFYTFLPSFFFIFAGAPFIESTRSQVRFAAPLMAISAAVVGVILNLALFLALQVFWPPRGFDIHGLEWRAPDAVALGIALLCGWLLVRRRWGVVGVIALAAALGTGASTLGLSG